MINPFIKLISIFLLFSIGIEGGGVALIAGDYFAIEKAQQCCCGIPGGCGEYCACDSHEAQRGVQNAGCKLSQTSCNAGLPLAPVTIEKQTGVLSFTPSAVMFANSLSYCIVSTVKPTARFCPQVFHPPCS
jgi:hypothetical protein